MLHYHASVPFRWPLRADLRGQLLKNLRQVQTDLIYMFMENATGQIANAMEKGSLKKRSFGSPKNCHAYCCLDSSASLTGQQ